MFITVKFFKIRLSICSHIIVSRLWNNIMFKYMQFVVESLEKTKEIGLSNQSSQQCLISRPDCTKLIDVAWNFLLECLETAKGVIQ